jgi:hypothetical protein
MSSKRFRSYRSLTKIRIVVIISFRATYRTHLVLPDLLRPWQSIYIYIQFKWECVPLFVVLSAFYSLSVFLSSQLINPLVWSGLWSWTEDMATYWKVCGGSRPIILKDHKQGRLHTRLVARVYLVQ